MKFPREWPGFIVSGDCCILVMAGAIVEGISIDEATNRVTTDSPVTPVVDPTYRLGCRAIFDDHLTAINTRRHPHGWGGALIPWDELIPLTPTARAWKRARTVLK